MQNVLKNWIGTNGSYKPQLATVYNNLESAFQIVYI